MVDYGKADQTVEYVVVFITQLLFGSETKILRNRAFFEEMWSYIFINSQMFNKS